MASVEGGGRTAVAPAFPSPGPPSPSRPPREHLAPELVAQAFDAQQSPAFIGGHALLEFSIAIEGHPQILLLPG
eukprot:6572923-Pyramimonas_sp.AAC.1